MIVTFLATWLVMRVLTKFSAERRLARSGLALLGLVVVQVFLGIGAYLMKEAARNAPQPLPPVVAVTTTHLAVGALVLVSGLFLTFQTYRFLATPGRAVKVAASPEKAAI